VGALRKDLVEQRTERENPTLETSLSAMESWIRDMDAFYKNHGQPPSHQPAWKTFADIRIAAKVYE